VMEIVFPNSAAFEEWLEANSDFDAGVWLKIAKKGSGVESITSEEAVDSGLCFGWISGQRKSLDEIYYLQKYVPRRPRSLWSQVNVDKVLELTAAGRMRPRGMAEVVAAKADGRWSAAYESQRNAVMPEELTESLKNDAVASAAFHKLGKTAQYTACLKIVTARSARARAKRVQRLMDTLRAG
jgi:uncharacterized protein YdeI (YjbR/CyaY-like superfamily)